MTTNVSITNTVVKINNVTIEGFAAQADALSMPDIEVITEEVGADGLLLVSSTGMRGGLVEFKMQVNSSGYEWFGQQFTEILQGAVKNFEGSVSYTELGLTVRLNRGAMKMGASGISLGNAIPAARVFGIYFETVLGNFAAFQASPIPSQLT